MYLASNHVSKYYNDFNLGLKGLEKSLQVIQLLCETICCIYACKGSTISCLPKGSKYAEASTTLCQAFSVNYEHLSDALNF